MGLLHWLQRCFLRKPSANISFQRTAGVGYSIPIRSDRTLEDLVDFIWNLQSGCRLDALCAYTSMEFGISAQYAALAWDRVQEGIERAASGDLTECPNQVTDPVAWISFHRAVAAKAAGHDVPKNSDDNSGE